MEQGYGQFFIGGLDFTDRVQGAPGGVNLFVRNRMAEKAHQSPDDLFR